MTRPLAGHPVATAPPAYDVLVVDEGPLIYVHVHAADGSIAAHGMAAVVGTDVVMHDIETEATHRRRGLGRVVMGALVQRGVERGAEHGLLMATEVGTHLYRALGWSTEAILVTATGPTPARAELTETLSSI
nr:GNAT family N-acetyltransferase [Kribbella sandramycini]